MLKPWKDTEEHYMHITKWKKPIQKGYTWYDSNYMTFWKRQGYGDSKRIRGFQGRRGWKGEKQPWGPFQCGNSSVRYYHGGLIACLPNPIEGTALRVSKALWVVVTYPRRCVDCNKCTSVCQDVDKEEGCAFVRAGDMGAVGIFCSFLLWTSHSSKKIKSIKKWGAGV